MGHEIVVADKAEDFNNFNRVLANATRDAREGKLGLVDAHLGALLQIGDRLGLKGVDQICRDLMRTTIGEYVRKPELIDLGTVRTYASKYNIPTRG